MIGGFVPAAGSIGGGTTGGVGVAAEGSITLKMQGRDKSEGVRTFFSRAASSPAQSGCYPRLNHSTLQSRFVHLSKPFVY